MLPFAALMSAIFAISPPANLLINGGFESWGGWTLSPGIAIVSAGAHAGAKCLEVRTAESAQAEQLVLGAPSSQQVTLRAWMRTTAIARRADTPGFAFIALYQFDNAGRLLRHRDIAQVGEPTPWREYTATEPVHPAADYLAVRVGIHNGSGAAWFDEVSLAVGESAAEASHESARVRPSAEYRVAVLDDSGLPAVGAATPAAAIKRALTAPGITVYLLDGAAVCDATRLNAQRYDLLVVPCGASYPAEGRAALLRFLSQGGDLLTTGGYAFDALHVREQGRWVPYSAYVNRQRARARDFTIAGLPNGGFEKGLEGWETTAGCRVVANGAFAGTACGEAAREDVEGTARFRARLDVQPGHTYLVGAHARLEQVRGAGFAFLAVYQWDREGKLITFRDFWQATGSAPWRRVEAAIQIAPNAARVTFEAGLYRAAGRVWLDDVTCAAMEPEVRINAHYGEPGDGLKITPTQLTLFSPDQRFAGGELVPAGGVGLPGWRSPGPVRGYEATAQLRQNARWTPLLEARDRYGRFAGAAGALVRHYGGPFAGSQWALFGVTNRDIFRGEAGERLLRHTVELLRAPRWIETVRTDLACYRPGETATVTIAVAPPRGAAPTQQVAVELRAPGSARPLLARRLPVPSTRMEVSFQWRVPQDCPDFVRVTATLLGDRSRDTAETAFAVWRPEVVARGTAIAAERNRIRLQKPGAPASAPLLFGTDTYGNMFWSRSANPLTWYRDLRMMRDHGLHLFENLQFTPQGYAFTEAQWRQLDGLILLSQRFGLPYMAGLLIGQNVAVDDATLAAQAAFCRAFAARYKGVPGLIYYLNGDYVLNLSDIPDIRRLWNGFLAERYGTDERLRRAWGEEAPAETLGEIPVAEVRPARWYSPRVRDLTEFKAALVRRWNNALAAAIRAEDAAHPITSEYYQRTHNGIDARLSIGELDLANIGYFGPPRLDFAQLPAFIKWNDQRLVGKSVNIGEFGVKTHDAWAAETDGWGYHTGRTEEEQRRLFWWVVHAALALDVTKIQNWCWSDDPDGVFPWGVAWNNPLRPKPVLKLWRNLRAFSDLVAREDRRDAVVFLTPDGWRLGAPEDLAERAVLQALECLLACGVGFAVAGQRDLGLLEAQAPGVLIAPLAYAIEDDALARILRLAERGWQVYLSGDPAIGPDGHARSERYALLGVRLVGEDRTPEGLPAPRLEPDGAERLLTPLGIPMYRKALGEGALWLAPTPWEALPGRDLFLRDAAAARDPRANLYLWLLHTLGHPPTARITDSQGVWHAAATPSGPDLLVTLYPRGEAPSRARVTLQTPRGALAMEPLRGWPCAVLLDAGGRPRAATGGGALRRGSREEVRGTAPWMLSALDGKPLTESGALAATMAEGGTLQWRSAVQGLRAWLAEWRDGGLVTLAPAPLTRTQEGWQLRAEPNELVIICHERDLTRLRRQLAR